MELWSNVDSEKTIGLLQLTPKLKESLEAGTLVLKSSTGGDAYFCTRDSTHAINKLKQSNTLLLTASEKSKLTAFASPSETLETVEVTGKVDWSVVPEYCRGEPPIVGEQVWDCSPAELQQLCREKPAIEINGVIYRIAPDLVHDTLVHVVSTMVEGGDIDLQGTVPEKLDSNVEPEVVRAVHAKFCTPGSTHMDTIELSRWVGLYILRQHGCAVDENTFVREWALDLPVKLTTDVSLLQGHVVHPSPGQVEFVDVEKLPNEVTARLSYLFAFKKQWPMSEIEPFLLPLMPASQKLENWLLKFARIRRERKPFVVSPLRR